MKYNSVEEWKAEATRRFGPDMLKWRFRCPMCGHRRKAQEAYDAYQSTGMTRYDNAYHKYEALADALDRDVQKADTRQAAASLKSELIMLASAASRAKLPSAPEGALLALAKEVIAVGRLYGYDGKEMDA